MRIAICDDDTRDLLQIASLLESYRRVWKADFSYVSFQNATDLLTFLECNEVDLLLLDILMPGINGMEAAREIRERNGRIEIVFMTSSPEYAVESYSVRAHHYLMKPASEGKLFPILDRLLEALKSPEDALRIKTQTRLLSLPYQRIEYLEVRAKKLYFYLTDGSSHDVSGKLAEYEQALQKRPGFMKVHRSYLVNMRWVMALHKGELTTLMGRRVPVARMAYPHVRTAYTRYLFEEAEEAARHGGGAPE